MRCIALILFIFSWLFSFPQECNIEKLDYYVNAAENNSDSAVSNAFVFAKKAFEISKRCNITKYYFKGFNIYCKLLLIKSESDSVISLIKPILDTIKVNDSEILGTLNLNISSAYGNILQPEKSIKHALKAVEAFKKVNIKGNEINAYINIGNAYRQLHNMEYSIKYLQEGLAILKTTKNKEVEGNLYNTIGITYAENNMLDSAEKYFLISTRIREQLHQLASLAWNYNNLGGVYVLKDNISQAILYLEKAFKVFETNHNYDGQSDVCNNLGELYSRINDFKNALKYFNYSRSLYNKTNNPDNLESLYTNLYNLFKIKGDRITAIAYADSLMSFKDSIYSVRIDKSIAEMQAKFDVSKRDQLLKEKEITIKLKEKEILLKNTLFYFVFVFCILIIIIIAVFLNKRKLKEKARLDAEMALERQQLSDQILLSEQKERMRIARDLHDSIGQKLAALKMMFNSLNFHSQNTIKELDTTIIEVRNISHNLIPEELNFGLFPALESLAEKSFPDKRVIVKIDDNCWNTKLEPVQSLNIYRITQEIIGNSIKHSSLNEFILTVTKERSVLAIYIEDDGPKINYDSIKRSTGIGWKNIIARLNLLNGQIEIVTTTKNKIKITIPLNNQLNG